MNANNAPLWLACALLLAFSVPLFFVYVRGHRPKAAIRHSLDERWLDSRLEISQAEFELYQILPSNTWKQAKLIIRDEKGATRAEIILHSHYRADIKIGKRLLSAFNQMEALGPSLYAGLVGGSTDRSIVIRDRQRVLVEMIPETNGTLGGRRFTWKGETYTIDERVISVRDQIIVVRSIDDRIVGQFASQDWAGLAEARYVAVRRNFDPMVGLWLCYLATVASCTKVVR
ncbi:MAG: hypothetical protein H0U63_02170 [Burkholderiales bacterium]|nr:hypothetical protein [Burkholderiales bacterium]